jgi:3-hydroxybutyrate dehydrogenase
MRLKNKVALVTGAASGIGKAIATRFAKEGATVGVADLDNAGAANVVAELARFGALAVPVAMDVTDETQVETRIQELVDRFGAIDVLVSNAGIQIVQPIELYTFADWKRMLAIHLDGAFLTTRACFRQMKKQPSGGSVIYIGSVHSKEESPLKSAYVKAKHGLIRLAKTVDKEDGRHGIRANVVCPGFVRTPLVDKQIPEQAEALGISEEEVIQKIMLGETVDGQFTTLDDVAEAVLQFAAFPSAALTGQSLVVSHGWSMQ